MIQSLCRLGGCGSWDIGLYEGAYPWDTGAEPMPDAADEVAEKREGRRDEC